MRDIIRGLERWKEIDVSGFTKGLKSNQLRRIEKLATRRVSPDQIISPELARQMSELSHETGRQIGVLLNRKGQVDYVMVGDAKKIEMPDFGRARVSQDRFRGLRCIHTHLNGEKLTNDDLTDLALLRLDLMAIIQVDRRTGLPGDVHAAHLVPANPAQQSADISISLPYEFLKPAPPSSLDVDFGELIVSLEDEMARVRLSSGRTKAHGKDRVILVGVTTGHLSDAEDSMKELEELALSADTVVLDKIIQRRPNIDPRTVLGKGKLEELLIRAMRTGADMLVFDAELSPAQVRSISEATELKVVDRPQLILDIFAQRAQSREGKLQVELAQLKYMLPRLAQGANAAFSRLAGGIGGRGPGETKLETDRRRVRDRIAQLEKHLPIISLVGYTNAGKSTLLNSLTNSDVYAEQKMFATLDPTSRRLRLPIEQEVIINDTVGFIRDLPETLVAAFRATLEEISDSDLILHIVDASNPRCMEQISSVNAILGELGLSDIKTVVVLNKSDLLDESESHLLEERVRLDNGIATVSVSALRGSDSLRKLIDVVGETIELIQVPTDTAGRSSETDITQTF